MWRNLWIRWLARRPDGQQFIFATPEVARLRLRLLGVFTAREMLRWGAAWIAIWATAAVLCRGLMWTDRVPLLWGSVGLLAVVAFALIIARRRVPSSAALLAALDSHNRLGGILMTAGEQEIGRWQEHVRRPSPPQIHWNSRREWRFLFASFIFLVIAFAIPDRLISQEGNARLEIEGDVQQLTEKLELLREEEVVEETKADELKRTLEQIQEEARGRDPEKTLEAIDHLNSALSKAASDAANDILQQVQAAADAKEAAESLAGAQSEGNAPATADAMKQLARQVERAAQEGALVQWDNPGANGLDLNEMMVNAIQEGLLTTDQMNALILSLKQCQRCREGRLKRLCDAMLIDPEFLVLCEKECDSAFASKGGINRGRGDAEMTWQHPSEVGDAQFKEKALPDGAITSVKEAPIVGLSASDPTAKEPTEGSTGDALKGAQSGSGDARTQRLLPKYKRTVQQYFDRGGK